MNDEVCYDGTSGDPTVCWWDGGGTTGWAVISVHPDALVDPECFVGDNITYFACGEFYGNEFMQVDQMISMAEAWPGAALGVENWVLYESSHYRKDDQLTSLVRINAAFRYGLHLRQIERDLWVSGVSGPELLRGGPPSLLDEFGKPVKRDIPKVFRQNAVLATRDLKDAVLKAIDYRGKSLYALSTGSDHARDATKHALTFLKRLKGSPPLRAEAFPLLRAA